MWNVYEFTCERFVDRWFAQVGPAGNGRLAARADPSPGLGDYRCNVCRRARRQHLKVYETPHALLLSSVAIAEVGLTRLRLPASMPVISEYAQYLMLCCAASPKRLVTMPRKQCMQHLGHGQLARFLAKLRGNQMYLYKTRDWLIVSTDRINEIQLHCYV